MPAPQKLDGVPSHTLLSLLQAFTRELRDNTGPFSLVLRNLKGRSGTQQAAKILGIDECLSARAYMW